MSTKNEVLVAPGERKIIVTRVFHAPRELVFKAMTDPSLIARWWGPRYLSTTVDKMDVRPGGRWRYVQQEPGGREHAFNGTYREIVPPERLVHTFSDEGWAGQPALVTVTLEDESGKTRLTSTTLFGTREDLEAFASKGARKGAAESMERLSEVLREIAENGAGTPGREIVVSRTFDAPRELLWEAMTDPAQVVKWWGPHGFTTTIETMDVRPGGAWNHVMRGPDGTDYPNRCVFREVVRPERIVFSNGGGRKGGHDVQFVATWTFDALAAAVTRVTIRMVFPTAAERDRVAKEYGAVEGARQTLERMAGHLLNRGSEPGEFVIERVVDAPRGTVFKAWTEAERLARWFGPKGCTITQAKMELSPGGVCHFCMRMPDGRDIWGRWVFREIVAPARIVFVSSFSDEKGGLAGHPAIAHWPLEILTTITFEEQGAKTRITVRWAPHMPTAAEREAFGNGRDMMRMGWTGTFEQLEAYLALPVGGVP